MTDRHTKPNNTDADPDEGHTREWQDRARIVDPKDNIDTPQLPNQSNVQNIEKETEDVEEKSPDIKKQADDNNASY